MVSNQYIPKWIWPNQAQMWIDALIYEYRTRRYFKKRNYSFIGKEEFEFVKKNMPAIKMRNK